jgi:putative transcriptional regulator
MDSGKNYKALLKQVRDELGLSQEDLARELGVSYATVNRWENGQARPSKLARVQLEAFCDRKAQEGSLSLSKPKQISDPRDQRSHVRAGRRKR